jgi:carbonic anhydrase
MHMSRYAPPILLLMTVVFLWSSCEPAKKSQSGHVLATSSDTPPSFEFEYKEHGNDWASNPEGVGCAVFEDSTDSHYFESPIDITYSTPSADKPLEIHYAPFTEIVDDNGHTIQVNTPDSNAFIIYQGQRYNLLQFHFHAHSENQINGHISPMELHLVHKNTATGRLTVIGVMLEEGAHGPAFDRIWAYIPGRPETTVRTDVLFDPSTMLPAKGHFFAFKGSLTTPACTGNLNWIVMKEPVHISSAQLEVFKKHYPDNFRNLQPLHGRAITEYAWR